jgi:hypothetical protein
MPSENVGSINIDLEQLRRSEERLRQLSEQLQNSWISTSSYFSANDLMSIGSYQMGISEPQEVDNLEIHEIGGEDVVRKEVRLTEIPRKPVKECGLAIFCKKNFK